MLLSPFPGGPLTDIPQLPEF